MRKAPSCPLGESGKAALPTRFRVCWALTHPPAHGPPSPSSPAETSAAFSQEAVLSELLGHWLCCWQITPDGIFQLKVCQLWSTSCNWICTFTFKKWHFLFHKVLSEVSLPYNCDSFVPVFLGNSLKKFLNLNPPGPRGEPPPLPELISEDTFHLYEVFTAAHSLRASFLEPNGQWQEKNFPQGHYHLWV